MQISNQIKSIAYGVLISSFFTIALQGEAKGASLIIDSFTNVQTLTDSTPADGPVTNSFGVGGAFLGTDREFTANLLTRLFGGANVTLDSVGDTTFSIQSGSSSTATAQIDYLNLPNVDLTNSQTLNVVAFGILANDQPVDLTLNLNDGTNSFGITKRIPTISFTLPAQEIYYPLATFIAQGVDVTSITGIQVNWATTNNNGSDTLLNFIEAQNEPSEPPLPGPMEIPEPTSIISILGLGGLILTSRRKKPNQDKNDKID